MDGEKRSKGPFSAKFTYTEAILKDFEGIYNQKKKVTPLTRIVCAVLGLAGVVFFGLDLYRNGLSVARLGYMVACSILLLIAVSGGRDRGDETVSKYTRHYKGRQAVFTIDEDGVTLQISGQKNKAQSPFNKIYGLFETEMCFYFVISGKAYYILPKRAISGGSADDLRYYMEKKCKKKFMRY